MQLRIGLNKQDDTRKFLPVAAANFRLLQLWIGLNIKVHDLKFDTAGDTPQHILKQDDTSFFLSGEESFCR
jgi:hypothetical protein